MNATGLSPSAQRVQDALHARGIELQVRELAESTRTAQDAALALGCEVGQIAKSLIFVGTQSRMPILLIVSGANRVDLDTAAAGVGEALARADAEFVRSATGFAIGGVPPVGHHAEVRTFIDRDLLKCEVIWAAAGTPRAVFSLTAPQLIDLTHADIIAVA